MRFTIKNATDAVKLAVIGYTLVRAIQGLGELAHDLLEAAAGEEEVPDESYLYGRCDTCGAPLDELGCVHDFTHEASIDSLSA